MWSLIATLVHHFPRKVRLSIPVASRIVSNDIVHLDNSRVWAAILQPVPPSVTAMGGSEPDTVIKTAVSGSPQ